MTWFQQQARQPGAAAAAADYTRTLALCIKAMADQQDSRINRLVGLLYIFFATDQLSYSAPDSFRPYL